GVESIPGIAEATKHWGRMHRRDRRNAVEAEFEPVDLDEIFGATSNHSPVATRQTDHLLIEGAEVLEALVSAHGLKAVIATLRPLCDSHVGVGCDEHAELS